MGYLAGQAYLSKLAYLAARGRVRTSDELACRRCAANAAAEGWCDTCRVGRVGPLALDERDDFLAARDELARLRAAIAKLETCATCAVASFTGGRCPVCRISYREGRPRG
jgi:hypothetical protein